MAARRIIGLALLAAVGSLGSLGGCGAEPEPPPPPPPDPSIELSALCDELASAECGRLAGCGLLGAPFDDALCRKRQVSVQCAALIGQVTKLEGLGQVAYDPVVGGACRDAIAAAGCDEGLERSLFADEACQMMVQGQSEESGRCTMNVACVDGLFCDATAQQCPGRCRAFKQNNARCGGPGEFCAPELFCATTARRCRARVALGAQCELSQDNSCADGGFCDSTEPGGPKCVPVRGRGTACTSPYQCRPGLRCVRNICTAGEAGDVCQRNLDCNGRLRCGADMKCAEPVEVDTECDPDGAPCREGLTCTSSMGETLCRVQPVSGQPCGASTTCYLSRCVDGTCAEPSSDGSPCESAADCLPERLCDEGLCTPPIACRL